MNDKLNIILDSNDYDEKWPKYERIAVRGIVKKDNKYALVKSKKYGDYKFPGGGMEEGEGDLDTLKREIFEEVGIVIDVEQAAFYGDAIELCHSPYREDVYKHISHYYLYDMTGFEEVESEIEKDGQLFWLELDKAISNNYMVEGKLSIPWLRRETMVMEKLQKKEEI